MDDLRHDGPDGGAAAQMHALALHLRQIGEWKSYLTSTSAPDSASFALTDSASSFVTPSLLVPLALPSPLTSDVTLFVASPLLLPLANPLTVFLILCPL